MQRIKRFEEGIQQVAEAISAVLGLDVTVVDSLLVRLAGTGKYYNRLGAKLPEGCGYEQLIKSNENRLIVILNPGKNKTCYDCTSKFNCPEKAHISAPIIHNENIIGVIGLTAFNEEQKEKLIYAEKYYRTFINEMSNLLANWFLNETAIENLTKAYTQMNTIVNSTHEGILAVDEQGKIIAYNKSAKEILSLPDNSLAQIIYKYLPETDLTKVLVKGEFINSKEIFSKERNIHCIFNAKPIIFKNKIVGVVLTLNDMSEMQKIAFGITGNEVRFTFDTIVGKSKEIIEAKNKGYKAAKTSSTVLLRGESGTGKDHFARAIHSASNRADKPFVCVHCAAIPESLLESELFGYEEGAFTGAKKGGKPGKFEMANGGTIFLDEIGDMSIHLQVKLLRVLQDGTFERVGGKDTKKADVKIIAATHQPLEKMIENKKFREDLFFRLNVIPIRIPSLKERKDDIEILINCFLEKYKKKLGLECSGFSKEAYEMLIKYDWVGNVRELQNTVEYSLNMKKSDKIEVEDLPHSIRIAESKDLDKTEENLLPIDEMEKRLFQKAVNIFGTNEEGKKLIANKLGVSRATVYRKLKKYNLSNGVSK